MINPLEHFYKNLTDNAFIFQNYVLDVYQQRREMLETVQHPCKVDLNVNSFQAKFMPPMEFLI